MRPCFGVIALPLWCGLAKACVPKKSMNVMKQQSSYKEMALSFYKEIIGKRDIARADEIIAENYIQHNPQLKTGRAGVLEALEYLKKMPAPPANAPSPIRRVIAEGEFVALHLAVDIGGTRKYVVDIFRIESGKLAEHWDAIQDEPVVNKNGYAMIDGPTEILDIALTGAHSALVKAFADEVLQGRSHERIPEWVSVDLVQHDPQIDGGAKGLQDFLAQPRVCWRKVHHIIVEGNFAVVQSEISVAEEPFVRYDVFRLSNLKIAEQWSVQQAVPPRMMHTNGMI
jgi:predicted SnoaL-like aldol condensation-catalyzing enzyme